MKKLKNIIIGLYREFIKIFIRSDRDSVYAVSGHATLFIIISFFPLITLILSLIKFLPFSRADVLALFDNISLGIMQETVKDAVSEVYDISSSFTISLSAIAVLWAASTSVYSIILGLNRVYGIKETRNYFLVRSISLLYTVIVIFAIAISLALTVFGKGLLKILLDSIDFLKDSDTLLNIARAVIPLFVLTILFVVLYTYIPNRRTKLIFELPGAILAALGWYVFSIIYGLYISSNKTVIYGSITTIVLMMIWLYFCIYIFFIGAELNRTAEEYGWCKIRRQEFYEKLKRKEKNGQKIHFTRP